MDLFNSTKAIVRKLPGSYSLYNKPDRPMSLSLAQKQHALYVQSLNRSGLQVEEIPADEHWYDCVFVEDTVVVWKNHALITRMQGDRSGEHGPVRDYLGALHEIVELNHPSSLL